MTPVVINRLDDFFRQQEEQALKVHATATAVVLERFISDEVDGKPVVAEVNGQLVLNPDVEDLLINRHLLEFTANDVAQADVRVVFGTAISRTPTASLEVTHRPEPRLSRRR